MWEGGGGQDGVEWGGKRDNCNSIINKYIFFKKEVFKVMKGKDLHPRLLYPAKLSLRMEGKIKCFSDKVKLKEFIITKPLLYEMLKGLI